MPSCKVILFSLCHSEYDVSYAQVAGAGDKGSSGGSNSGARSSDSEFCSSYLMTGICEVGDHCTYIHGQFCEMCQLAYLHPYDKEQRRIHREVRSRGLFFRKVHLFWNCCLFLHLFVFFYLYNIWSHGIDWISKALRRKLKVLRLLMVIHT